MSKKEYIQKEIIDSLGTSGMMIGVNGSPVTLVKKGSDYLIYVDNELNVLFTGNEEDTLAFLEMNLTA